MTDVEIFTKKNVWGENKIKPRVKKKKNKKHKAKSKSPGAMYNS